MKTIFSEFDTFAGLTFFFLSETSISGKIGLENPHSSHTKFSENPRTSISPPRILRTSFDLHLGHILVVFMKNKEIHHLFDFLKL